MPAVCYTKPGEGGYLSFDDAPAWYDQNTEVPSEAIRLLTSLEGDPRRLGLNLSPSSLASRSTCIRQLLIKKFFPYAIDGTAEWQATEGTIWHKAFDSITENAEDEWDREVLLPDFLLDFMGATPDCVRLWEYTPHHKSYEVEIFPDIWVNGRTDKLAKDLSEIQDFKTKAFPGWKDRKTNTWKVRHYPPDEDVTIQLNAYRRMVEVLTGVNPEKLTVRQMYRGSKIAKESWKKYDIEVWSNDQLESKIRPHVETFRGHAVAMKEIKDEAEAAGNDPLPGLFKYLAQVPLDGEHMFNGLKCPMYCTQMPICFEQAGKVRFDSAPGETSLIRPEDIT